MNTLRADEPFLSHYQLDHDPFAARVPDFKFYPAQRKTILGQLHHLARHSQLMQVVTGPKGSGKTLLKQAFIASINKENVTVISLASADCPDVADVLQILAHELKAEENTPVAIIERVNQLAEQGITFYLMVDDADQLSEDVIQFLINLANEQLPGLHLFLFAKASLLPRLENSVIGKEVTFNLPLTPYSLEETKEYLAIRLEGAGQTSALFSQDQLEDIQAQSAGWPGIINQVARDFLIENMGERQLSAEADELRGSNANSARPASKLQLPKVQLPKKHLMIAGGVAACLIVAVLFMNRSHEPDVTPTVVTNTTVTPVITTENTTTQTIPLDNSGNNQPLAANTTPVDPTTPVLDVVPTAPPANTPPAVVSSQPTSSAPNITAPTITAPPVVATNDRPTQPTAASKPPTQATATTKPLTQNTTVANAWYSKQPSAHFVIQVSVASTEKSAKEFIAKNSGDYHYFKRSRVGKIDYVISYGNFASRAEAQNAIKKLPANIQQSKPWVRTFASIKQELAN